MTNYSFECCSSITQIKILSSVTKIGKSSFKGCISLQKIIIPSSVEVIGPNSIPPSAKIIKQNDMNHLNLKSYG